MYKEIRIGKLKFEIETGYLIIHRIKFSFMIIAGNYDDEIAFGVVISLFSKELALKVAWVKEKRNLNE